MSNVIALRPEQVSVKKACEVLLLNRSSVYRKAKQPQADQGDKTCRKKAPQPRALTEEERAKVVETLVSETYRDQPPMEVYHDLLDQGVYLCSVRTMHRILHQEKANGERRNQRAAKKMQSLVFKQAQQTRFIPGISPSWRLKGVYAIYLCMW